MLVKAEREPNVRRSGVLFLVAIGVILFGLMATSDYTPSYVNTEENSEVIFCDLETVEGEHYIQGAHKFTGANLRTTQQAYSGEYSCKLGGGNIYGIGYQIDNPVPKTMYQASVWAYRTSGDRGRLAVSASDGSLYKEVQVPVTKNDDNWELLQLYFTIPKDAPDFVKVYVYSIKGAGAIFFDDLKIVPRNYADVFADSTSQTTSMHLSVSKKNYKKLETKKWDAVAAGVLISTDDDWVKGDIQMEGNQLLPVSMRLKGDWLDHLKNKKWSFRMKVKDARAWNDMITFSVQSPSTRNFLYEWLYHRFLEEVDVLTPRYDFMNLTLNEKEMGVYAYEEHFDKQLVESKERREGPILKLTEDGFWMSFKVENDLVGKGVEGRIEDAYWESDIRPFKEKRTLSNPKLAAQFERAQNMLFGFKYGQLSIEEVFDVDRFAKYHAMTDLHRAYHGFAWHNIRFYYNPVTARIEPIGYDGYGGKFSKLLNGPIFGYYRDTKRPSDLLSKFFANADFVRSYHQYLDKYSSAEWFAKRLTVLEDEIKAREFLIQSEYSDVTLDVKGLLSRAREIRYLLYPKDNESLRVKTVSKDEDTRTVAVFNAHSLPLDVIGYSNTGRSYLAKFDARIFVPRGNKYDVPEPVLLEVPVQATQLVFAIAGLDSLAYSEISGFSQFRVFEDKNVEFDADQFDFIDQIGNEVVIRSGKNTLSSNLDIPKGLKLFIEPGTMLDVVNSARIIVRGPVFAPGTAEDPILITSSDRSASGFAVIEAGSLSEFNYTEIKGFNTLREPGWTLTGAFTFYESDLKLRNCRIIENSCEDALNTVRSHIDIDGLYIGKTAFDGFDADFCRGKISNAIFNETGNDAIDFSGSIITITECKISNAGDKGISVGEASRLTVTKAEIVGCNIGVASKDRSLCDIAEIVLKDCKQGFTAYQKKPEYGPADLKIGKYTVDNVKQLYLLDRGSTLTLDGRKIVGE